MDRPDPAPRPSPAGSPGEALAAVCAAYWDWQLEESPIYATYLGLRRGLDRLDDAGPAARARREGRLQRFLLEVEAVAPDALAAEERITRSVLLRDLSEGIEAFRHRAWESALDQLGGPHIAVQDLIAVQPLEKPADAEALLARLSDVPRFFQAHMGDLRDGIASGRTAARPSYERVLSQVRATAKTPPQQTSFATATARFPATWPAAERARLTTRLLEVVASKVLPAYRALGAFLEGEYAGKARQDPGVWSIPGGPEAYAFAVRSHTTTNLAPDRIHQIGKDELEKNEREMLEIAREQGHAGDLREFLESVGKDPRFRLKTREQVLSRYREICARMDRRLPEVFGRLPRTGYEVRALEEYREKDAPAAYYLPPAEDGSRGGIFWANTHAPESWPTYDMETLSFHEAVPGHHLQIAVARELGDLPAIRTHAQFTAYVEGWAHYTERLADEMGAYSTPYDRLGMLAGQAWRAARLVVDTGLHHLKWDREKALRVLERVRSGPSSDVANELDRYITWPGQALAYKIGQRTFFEVRERARRRLGARFSLKGFHDEALRHGALPLSIFEDAVRSWEPAPA